MDKKKKKTCFLITPIGHVGDATRKRVDQWLELIYKPELEKFYNIVRADQIAEPGLITEQILDNIINADLAIIDYTDKNPNVMYEAAVRHIAKKPFIQISPAFQSIPFDIKYLRSIIYDTADLDYPKKLKRELKSAIKKINSPGYKVPEILKYQFDLQSIIKDPEVFIDLLTKNISFKKDSKVSKKGIYQVYGKNWYASDSCLIGTDVVCPSCGVVKQGMTSDHIINSEYSLSSNYLFTSKKRYKCENCGTEFEV